MIHLFGPFNKLRSVAHGEIVLSQFMGLRFSGSSARFVQLQIISTFLAAIKGAMIQKHQDESAQKLAETCRQTLYHAPSRVLHPNIADVG